MRVKNAKVESSLNTRSPISPIVKFVSTRVTIFPKVEILAYVICRTPLQILTDSGASGIYILV